MVLKPFEDCAFIWRLLCAYIYIYNYIYIYIYIYIYAEIFPLLDQLRFTKQSYWYCNFFRLSLVRKILQVDSGSKIYKTSTLQMYLKKKADWPTPSPHPLKKCI